MNKTQQTDKLVELSEFVKQANRIRAQQTATRQAASRAKKASQKREQFVISRALPVRMNAAPIKQP